MIASDAIGSESIPNHAPGCFPIVLAGSTGGEAATTSGRPSANDLLPAQRLASPPNRGLLRDGFKAELSCQSKAVPNPCHQEDPNTILSVSEYVIIMVSWSSNAH